MARVAFLTVTILRARWGNPIISGFEERLVGNFAAAEAREGFIAHAGFAPREWGEWATPACLTAEQNQRAVQTLSLWQDLESVYSFAYSGRHAEALRGRKAWSEPPTLPTYAAWWVTDGNRPTWAEAIERHASLHENGPTPTAFNFKTAFGSDGAPVTLDHARVKYLLSPTVE